MKTFQSYRKVKLYQLRLRICGMLIKIKETGTKIKLKKLRNLSRITERLWWLYLDPNTLIQHRTKRKQQYYSLMRDSINTGETYL